MVAGYVIEIRDRYTAKFSSREQVRKSMFMDLLELEVPELMQDPEWRGNWATTGELPLIDGPSEAELIAAGELPDNYTDEEVRSAILRQSHPIDGQITESIWSAIDEAMQLISDKVKQKK